MTTLFVVENPVNWPIRVRGAELVSASSYLTDPAYSEARGTRVFNLCRSYRYMSKGYYVSLLATARGHRALPDIGTIQDLRSPSIVRVASEDLEELVGRSLAPIRSQRFELSIYFGRNMAKRYDRLASAIFNLFPAPLLRARFVREDGWKLQSVSLISGSDVPAGHRDFVAEAAAAAFARRRPASRRTPRYDLAILVRPEAEEPPSDRRAIRKFVRAAASLGMRATVITEQDYGHLPEYDALFIRETTLVSHYTYRFAARAEAEGLVVIDDPRSILRCTNKVYLAELLQRRKVPTPRTVVGHAGNLDAIVEAVGFPCIVKRPDSSFSQGVEKADDEEELRASAERILTDSDLFIVQEFVPTPFDWRVGVLDRRPLFACRYFMADGHWQVMNWSRRKRGRYGRVETLPVEQIPRRVLATALRAANLVGDGLYGVDLKETARRVLVIEVNDNPNIEAGTEDRVAGDELYRQVMSSFLERIERRKGRR